MKKRFTFLIAALFALMLITLPEMVMGQSYEELYSADFTTVATHSYTQNKTFTLNDKSWTASVSQVNSGVFYLGCNNNNASKGILGNNSTFSDEDAALAEVDDVYTSGTSHAYALKFDNAYNNVTKVVFNWNGGNNAFQVYLFGDSGSGYELLESTDYASSGESVSGSVEWTGNATNYTRFAIVARPGTTTSTATNKTLRASTFYIYKTASPTQLATPTNFSATAGNTEASFSWTAVEHASSYTIAYTPAGGSEQTVTGITGTSRTITGLTNGTEYTCKIKAVGDGTSYSDSEYSSTITVTPTGATLYTVTVTSPLTGGAVSASPTTAAEGETITLTATSAAGYTFNNVAANWSITPVAVTITPVANTNTATFSMPGENVTAVAATFTPINVTLNPGTGTIASTTWNVTMNEGNLPTPTSPCDEWTFEGWSTANVSTQTDTRPTTFVETHYVPTAATTLYAVYKKTEGNSFDGETGGDYKIYAAVTNDNTTTNNYATGSVSNGKISSTTTASDATTYTFEKPSGYATNEFAIYTMVNNTKTYITYASSTNLGTSTNAYKWIVSNGTLGTWRLTSETSGRGFIYRAGSTNKFGGYSTGNVSATGTDYYDLEIGSSSSVYYTSPSCLPQVVKPQISPSGGTFTEVQSVTITCETDGATIYYTTDGSTPEVGEEETHEYSGAISVGTNMTIKAIAVHSGMEDSGVTTASFVINLPQEFATIDAFKAAFSSTSTEVVKITGPLTVVYQNGINIYVQDATGGLLIYDSGDVIEGTYTNGQTLSNVYGTYTKYNGLVEFIPDRDFAAPGVGTPVEPTDITSLTSANYATYESMLVRLTNAEFKANATLNTSSITNVNMEDASNNTVVLRNGFKTLAGSVANGDVANVTGFATIYNSTYQLFPRDNNDIQYILETMEVDAATTIDFAAILISGEIIEIEDGGILTIGGTFTNEGDVWIDEGGQLVCNNSVAATVKRTTKVWDASDETAKGWYAIASPVNTVTIASIVGESTHNVYRYDEEEVQWEEYRDSQNQFSILDNGRGYLYRSTVADIDFVGNVNVANANYLLTRKATGTAAGFHLIGNPYTHNIYKGENGAIESTYLEDGFYTLNVNGGWNSGTDNSTAIAPGRAILVQATAAVADIADGVDLTIYNKTTGYVAPTGDKSGNDQIMFAVKNAEYSDVAYVLFKEGHGLNKIDHRNAEIPMLYVINNGENFAIADMPDNTSVINLGFEAKTMGQYTISLKAEGQYSYMHLIDKLTGEDTDMLVEDSYTFIGSQSDRNDRFVLRLDYNAAGIDSESDIFAYQSGNDIIVRGEGTLQVFDITGRMVMSTRIDGVETINGIESGVYIFRMEGKTQKIVVR